MSQQEGNPGDIQWVLYNGCADKDHKAIKESIAAGANVNWGDYFKWTPLHWAASNDDGETFWLLVDAGVELAPQDKHGKTPLQGAKGSVKTLLTIASNDSYWIPSKWDYVCNGVQFKDRTSKKWSTEKICYLKCDVIDIYASGKTKIQTTVSMGGVTDMMICGETNAEIKLSTADNAYYFRAKGHHAETWMRAFKKLFGDRVVGGPIVHSRSSSGSNSVNSTGSVRSTTSRASNMSSGSSLHPPSPIGPGPRVNSRGYVDEVQPLRPTADAPTNTHMPHSKRSSISSEAPSSRSSISSVSSVVMTDLSQPNDCKSDQPVDHAKTLRSIVEAESKQIVDESERLRQENTSLKDEMAKLLKKIEMQGGRIVNLMECLVAVEKENLQLKTQLAEQPFNS